MVLLPSAGYTKLRKWVASPRPAAVHNVVLQRIGTVDFIVPLDQEVNKKAELAGYTFFHLGSPKEAMVGRFGEVPERPIGPVSKASIAHPLFLV
jgi:hypothetical protein